MANKNKKTGDKRNLKYGSLSVTVSVIFIALVIILNIITTSLSSVQGWYMDMTASGYYSLSEEFTDEMNKLLTPEGGTPTYVNIVLMAEEDIFSRYGNFAPYLYTTLKELEDTFENINIVAYNTTIHPELAEKYKKTALDTLALDDIVFELCDENGNAITDVPAKKYAAKAFFMMDSESDTYIGYNAESRILSAIALLTGKAEKPTAFYLQGHGEPTLDAASDWQEVLELGGFEVRELNLVEEDFTDVGDDDILVINCPKFDLVSTTELSEIKKIREFLGSNYGNMIVVEDANVPKLPALEGLLSEYSLGFGSSVTDSQHSVSGSGASKIFADYDQTYDDEMAGQVLTQLFESNSNLPNTIFTTPKEVIIYDDDETVGGMNTSNTTFSLLSSHNTAQTQNSAGEIVKGSVSLLGVSRVIWELNAGETSYIVALSSSDFLSSEYESSCANRNIMLELLKLMWDNTVSYDNITYKEFDDTALTNVSTAAASTWTILCVVVLPVIIAGLGVIVYVRRRHS